MGKLFNLKEWLTLPEAARQLSISFGEDVTEADVLRLGLDGRLQLSVYLFESVLGVQDKVVTMAERHENSTGLFMLDGTFCEFLDSNDDGYEPRHIDGLVGLVMKGDGVLAVERKYRDLLGTPSGCGVSNDFVEKPFPPILLIAKDDDLYVAENGQNGSLPSGAILSVRFDVLREFEQSINGVPASVGKPLATTERNTLLTIIAALCKYEGFDPQVRGAAQRIMEMTDDLGAHVDDGTILTVLKKIPDALETRMK